MGKIQVDFEVLPHVVDMDEARKPDAPLVFGRPVKMAGSAGGGGASAQLPQTGNVRGPKPGSLENNPIRCSNSGPPMLESQGSKRFFFYKKRSKKIF